MELKDISNLAIVLLTTAIVIVIMAAVLQGFQGNMTDQSTAHANVSLTWAGNNTAIPLGESRVIIGSLVLYSNGTIVNQGSTTAGVGNYTVTPSSIIITNISGIFNHTGGWTTSALNATYSYLIGSTAYNASNYGLTTTNTISSYLPLLGLVSIAAVIVGIVLVMFRRRNA